MGSEWLAWFERDDDQDDRDDLKKSPTVMIFSKIVSSPINKSVWAAIYVLTPPDNKRTLVGTINLPELPLKDTACY